MPLFDQFNMQGGGFQTDALAARAAQQQAQLRAVAPTSQKGIFGAMALGQAQAQRRAKRESDAEGAIFNEEFNRIAGAQAENGGEVDMAKVQEETVFAEARRIAATGAPGSAGRARELYNKGIELATARKDSELSRLKTMSEVDENVADAESARRPDDELVRLQDERENLRKLYDRHDPASVTAKHLVQRISEIDGRINKLNTVTGTTEFDPNAATRTTTSDLQSRVLGAKDRIARLAEVSASFDPRLLTIGSKVEAGGQWLANKLGVTTAEADSTLMRWTDLKQAAMADLNLMMKELSGTAVNAQEFERQLQVLPNPGSLINPASGDSPQEFQRKMENQAEWAHAALERYEMLLREGLLSKTEALQDRPDLVAKYPLDMFIPEKAVPPTLEDIMAKYAPVP